MSKWLRSQGQGGSTSASTGSKWERSQGVAGPGESKAFDVVKSLPDGSQVIQFNDGSMQVLNQEAGLASKDPDVVNAAMRGESPVEASKQKRAGEILAQPGARQGARGATLLK